MTRRTDDGWTPARSREALRASLEERQVRILLAEDDAAMRSLLAATLRGEGYDVTAVATANEVIGRLPADLVISDQRMPGLSGLDLLEAIRAFDFHVPVILISAFPNRELHLEARRLGAYMVLEKPFQLDDFVAAVKSVAPIGRRKLRRQTDPHVKIV
jgi:DNA-binding NtrC family response regulator